MAPPATPSPHRFLPGARRQPSPSKSAKPPSRLIHSTAVHQEPTPAPAANTAPQYSSRPNLPPSASQFAPTPRFSLAKPKPPTQQHNVTTSPPRSSLAHVLRPHRPQEDVEEAASSDHEPEDTEMLLTTEHDEIVQPSIEQDPEYQHQNQDSTAELPFSPKRRRLDSDVSPKQHPTGTTATPHPRFTHVPSTSTSTPAPASRPSFLRPPTPPIPAPLPQAFSPHRRGTAFIPGGTASTVQSWVVAAGQSAAQGRRQQQTYQYLQKQTQGEGWGFRVRVERAEEMEGGGWRVVGVRDDGSGEGVRCLLVGEGKGDVRVGGVVGVKGLGWRVDVEGEGEWWIGVGWEGGG